MVVPGGSRGSILSAEHDGASAGATEITRSHWHEARASVCGKAHVEGGIENQDYAVLARSHVRDAWVAVVSDGAGTATRAATGSRTTTREVAHALLGLAETSPGGVVGIAAFQATLEASILDVRRQFESSGAPLRDYHCTLVACLLTSDAGYVAQVGDSIALITRFVEVETDGLTEVDYFADDQCRLLAPERGEYANETHFITEPDWQLHLRVAELPPKTDAVFLMTDGAMDVAMTGRKVFRGFLSNMVGGLATIDSRAERDALMHAWLDARQAHRVTGDDKSLVALIRSDARSMAQLPVYLGPGPAIAPPIVDPPIEPPEPRSATATAPTAVRSSGMATHSVGQPEPQPSDPAPTEASRVREPGALPAPASGRPGRSNGASPRWTRLLYALVTTQTLTLALLAYVWTNGGASPPTSVAESHAMPASASPAIVPGSASASGSGSASAGADANVNATPASVSAPQAIATKASESDGSTPAADPQTAASSGVPARAAASAGKSDPGPATQARRRPLATKTASSNARKPAHPAGEHAK